MPFYSGSSADGSDMQEFQGMYVSQCGNYWSSEPFPEHFPIPETRQERRKRERLEKKILNLKIECKNRLNR